MKGEELIEEAICQLKTSWWFQEGCKNVCCVISYLTYEYRSFFKVFWAHSRVSWISCISMNVRRSGRNHYKSIIRVPNDSSVMCNLSVKRSAGKDTAEMYIHPYKKYWWILPNCQPKNFNFLNRYNNSDEPDRNSKGIHILRTLEMKQIRLYCECTSLLIIF